MRNAFHGICAGFAVYVDNVRQFIGDGAVGPRRVFADENYEDVRIRNVADKGISRAASVPCVNF